MAQNYADAAIEACTRAIQLRPDYAAAHNNLGNALRISGRCAESIEHFRRAMQLLPNLPEVHSNLANALSDLGKVAEAEAEYRAALRAGGAVPPVHSNLLYHLNYSDHDPRVILEEHRTFDRIYARALTPARPQHANDPDPDRRLRVGYISPDFRQHSVNYFVEPFLANHDHAAFEIFCYADQQWSDETTGRLRAYADAWREVTAHDDAALADLVRADRIDILIDLVGHTAGNRLLAFARKPAPVQATYLGYPSTTGLSAMDYRITDALADPPGMTEPFHSEQLIRLERCFLCYRPDENLPAVAQLPAPGAGHVTFGCFNNFAKISDRTLRVWSRVLESIPDARLLLKFRSLADPGTRDSVLRTLVSHGISADRVELLGHTPTYAEHLDVYARIDIALDPFPYNGTTTTCEALAMGIPVIALAGNTHVSRVGVSILTNVGLAELIAATPDDYVQAACALAADLSRLAQLRSSLRDRMHRSPLCDENAFTRNLESACRAMWRAWCDRYSGKHLS